MTAFHIMILSGQGAPIMKDEQSQLIRFYNQNVSLQSM
jgi:hypothetical protein